MFTGTFASLSKFMSPGSIVTIAQSCTPVADKTKSAALALLFIISTTNFTVCHAATSANELAVLISTSSATTDSSQDTCISISLLSEPLVQSKVNFISNG